MRLTQIFKECRSALRYVEQLGNSNETEIWHGPSCCLSAEAMDADSSCGPSRVEYQKCGKGDSHFVDSHLSVSWNIS